MSENPPMIFDEQAIEAAARLSYMARGYAPEYKRWDDLPKEVKKDWHVVARNILQAALDSLKERGLVRDGRLYIEHEEGDIEQWHAFEDKFRDDPDEPEHVLIAKVQP